MTVVTATVALNITFEGLLFMMKIEVAYSEKHTNLKTRRQQAYPSVFMTKTA